MPIEKNIEHFFQNLDFGFYSLKMDELAINPTATYHRKSNEVIGFCANHSICMDTLKFSHWSDFVELKNALTNKKIHLAREALFFAIGKNIFKI